ncbi:MAG: carboxypeptidase-like regulatory domain-containing protein, partial [Terriglobia bacterium]|nr:carboxypeptidase-like regulatory domain-containing protein [Terriglobia bacterium]
MHHFMLGVAAAARRCRTHGSAQRRAATWFAFVTMFVVFAAGAWGQDNATINGTVTDATSAVIPNASITLTDTAT